MKRMSLQCRYIIGYAFVFLIVLACQTQPKVAAPFEIEFETKKVERNSCIGDDCASVSISYPAFGDPKLQAAIERQIVQGMSFELQPETLGLDSAVIGFLDQFTALKAEFPEATSWEYAMDVRISFQNASMLSLVFDSFSFTGGAHPNSFRTFLNYDLGKGEIIPDSVLILDEKTLLKTTEDEFRKYHEVEEGLSLKDDGRFFLNEKDEFFLPAAIGFEEGNLILYYNSYEIGPYVMGPTELKIPFSDLAGVVCYLDRSR